MAYDADGNRISRVVSGGPDNGTDTYSYDFENRLISTVNGTTAGATGAYAYQYDYRTRRISRNESGAGGVTTAIVFSGGTSVQEYDNAATVPTVEYVRGSDYGGGVGGILYTLRGGVPSYTHENRRGDVVAKTDDTGSLTFQAQYNASGKVIADNGATLDRQKSNSKDCDPWGGINDGQRYSVIRGKIRIFLTRDPAGMIDGPNEYTYVNQNPWTHFDPEGLTPLDDKTRTAITKEIQQASEMVEVAYGPSGNDPGIASAKHEAFKSILESSKYADYMVFEQSVNPSGGAINKQKNPTRYAKNSVRPDVMLLKDSDYKKDILKGGGAPLAGKIDSIVDLKTGAEGITPKWSQAVSARTGVDPRLILETRSGGNLTADMGEARSGMSEGTGRVMSVYDGLGAATGAYQSLRSQADEMNNQNPYVGQTPSGLQYTTEFDRQYFHFLPMSTTSNYRVLYLNGDFAGGTLPISQDRFNAINGQMAKDGKTLNDVDGPRTY